jgi:hypothetical protein
LCIGNIGPKRTIRYPFSLAIAQFAGHSRLPWHLFTRYLPAIPLMDLGAGELHSDSVAVLVLPIQPQAWMLSAAHAGCGDQLSDE